MLPERSQPKLTRQGVNAFLALPAAPVLMVIIGSLGTQAAAVMLTDMLATIGAVGVTGLRMATAAVIMAVPFRPALGGMTRAINIVVYGVATGVMGAMVYAVIRAAPAGCRRHHRLPLPLRRLLPRSHNVARASALVAC